MVFLKLGLTAFGGPTAHLGYFRDEIVTRCGWVGCSRENEVDRFVRDIADQGITLHFRILKAVQGKNVGTMERGALALCAMLIESRMPPSAVPADQVRRLDWKVRRAFKGRREILWPRWRKPA